MPFIYHPDEPFSVNGAIRMLKTGDLNPQTFHWGSLIYYLNAILYLGYYLATKLSGAPGTLGDIPYLDMETIAVGWAPIPAMFLLSRVLVAITGAGSILLIYLIGREVQGRVTGLLAALLFAVSPTSVWLSHVVKSDTLLVFFCLMSVWGALRVVKEPKISHYVLAGAGAGLGASSKYNAGVILVSLLAAHWMRFGWRGILRKEIWVGLLAAAVAFVATTPFALLDAPAFLQGVFFDMMHYSTGHLGAEGNSFQWYASFLWDEYGLLLGFALCGILYIALSRSRQGAVLAIFPVLYFIFISLFVVHFETTILPIIPFVVLIGSLFLVSVFNLMADRIPERHWLAGGLALVVIALVSVPSLFASARNDLELGREDNHAIASRWIGENLPAGSRVAIEPYSPFVDHDRFVVEGFDDITAHPPEWYEQNGFEYVVFSYGSYGRFLEKPELYPEYVDRYNALWARFTLVMRFSESGDEIRIYKTHTAALPSHRVAARFGVYGAWLELVGYDWESGHLALYWRGLEPRRESFQLTARLIDSADREVARSSGSLLGSAASTERLPAQIVRVPWAIVAPAEIAPGLYHIELDVDGEGVGRIPVQSRNYVPISDKLFIGPIKVQVPVPTIAELQAAQRVNARFGDGITLQGYNLTMSRALRITLYWSSLSTIDKDYTVFIHLVDANGKVLAQVDSKPRGGAYPTSLWEAGEIIRDDYGIALPGDIEPGPYNMEIGMYEYPSLARLPVLDSKGNAVGDHLNLTEVMIR